VADGPRGQCSSSVLRVLSHLRFRSIVFSSFGWARFRMVRVCRADSPRVPGGLSACSPRTVCYSGRYWRFCLLFRTVPGSGPDGPRCGCGQSAATGRTVRVACADSPSLLAGRSARAWQPCSLVRFLPPFFRASACASRNRS
jgi:hypothetical protein